MFSNSIIIVGHCFWYFFLTISYIFLLLPWFLFSASSLILGTALRFRWEGLICYRRVEKKSPRGLFIKTITVIPLYLLKKKWKCFILRNQGLEKLQAEKKKYIKNEERGRWERRQAEDRDCHDSSRIVINALCVSWRSLMKTIRAAQH